MLTIVKDLPEGLLGIEAHHTVSGDDYRKVLDPMLSDAHQRGEHIRFLYHFCPDFDGFTAGAALNDLRVGLHYLRLFERCAIVTESSWIEHSTKAAAFLMPCPVRIFGESELAAAIEWLQAPAAERHVEAQILSDKGLLVVEPNGALSPEDFEYLAQTVDPWIEEHGQLNGLVLHAKKFPGWENLGGLIRHISFVRQHHQKIRRLAVSAEGPILDLVPKIASHFVSAEVKTFGYQEFEQAKRWAAGS